MFEDRNEEIIEKYWKCVCCELCQHCQMHMLQVETLRRSLPSSIAIENRENRIIALLCNSALHTAEASPFFSCEVTSAQNKKTKTAWNNSWNTTWYGLLHGRAAPLYVIAPFSWIFSGMPAGTSSEEVGLLGTHWSRCPDVTANRVFPFPLHFRFQVLQRLDDVVLRCLPSKRNESFKKRTHMRSWRILLWCASNQSGSQQCPAYGDLLHSCTAAHTHTDDTDNVDCFALQCLWTLHELKLKECLEHMRVSTTKYSTTLLPQTISCFTAFFSKIQERFMLQSHLSQSATQGDSLLWSVDQDPAAKTY